MKFTLRLLTLGLAASLSLSLFATGEEEIKSQLRTVENDLIHQAKKVIKEDTDRSTQKAILTMVGSAALVGASRFFQDRAGFEGVGKFFNLTAGEFQSACGLATIISAIGIFARKDIADTCRRVAWRIPVMAVTGGMISHHKVNSALTHIPLGLGDWFKQNPAGDKKGIFAIMLSVLGMA